MNKSFTDGRSFDRLIEYLSSFHGDKPEEFFKVCLFEKKAAILANLLITFQDVRDAFYGKFFLQAKMKSLRKTNDKPIVKYSKLLEKFQSGTAAKKMSVDDILNMYQFDTKVDSEELWIQIFALFAGNDFSLSDIFKKHTEHPQRHFMEMTELHVYLRCLLIFYAILPRFSTFRPSYSLIFKIDYALVETMQLAWMAISGIKHFAPKQERMASSKVVMKELWEKRAKETAKIFVQWFRDKGKVQLSESPSMRKLVNGFLRDMEDELKGLFERLPTQDKNVKKYSDLPDERTIKKYLEASTDFLEKRKIFLPKK